MIIGQQSKKHKIQMNGETLPQVDSFTYLGVLKNKEGTLEVEINKIIERTRVIQQYKYTMDMDLWLDSKM